MSDAVLQDIDLLLSARWVVPVAPRGVVLEHHAVAVHRGEIVALVPQAEAQTRYRAAEHVELGE
ncbi:MAG: TRZ/ATZ family hydrolase, partial [Pseudomonadota bacterium]|nr:TRZ/ATZ family hydrolase [Pseudomonadota bacterium]